MKKVRLKSDATQSALTPASRVGIEDVPTWHAFVKVFDTRAVHDDALGNQHRGLAFTRLHDLQKIGQRVDRHLWAMTPPTVQRVPQTRAREHHRSGRHPAAAVLHARRDAAVNYGAIGATSRTS